MYVKKSQLMGLSVLAMALIVSACGPSNSSKKLRRSGSKTFTTTDSKSGDEISTTEDAVTVTTIDTQSTGGDSSSSVVGNLGNSNESVTANSKNHITESDTPLSASISNGLTRKYGEVHFSKCYNGIEELKANTPNVSFKCGSITVPEKHKAEDENVEKLSLGILYVNNTEKENPTLVIQNGGPGGSSITLANNIIKKYPDITNDFNIIAVEQRGSLITYPNVNCNQLTDIYFENYNNESEKNLKIAEALSECKNKNSKWLNLENINTFEMASDVVFTAEKLGASKFMFYGLSYGAAVGQYLLNFYPQNIEKVIFDSPVRLGQSPFLDSIDIINERISENLKHYAKQINKTEDQVKEEIKKQATELQNKPIVFTFLKNGTDHEIILNGKEFMEAIEFFLGDSYSYPIINGYLAEIRASNVRGVEAYSRYYLPDIDLKYEFINNLIMCREYVGVSEAAYTSDNRSYLLSMAPEGVKSSLVGKVFEHRCDVFSDLKTPEMLLTSSVSSAVPALLMGGRLDVVTNPSYVFEIGNELKNKHEIIFDNRKHDLLQQDSCIYESAVGFLKSTDNNFKNLCDE